MSAYPLCRVCERPCVAKQPGRTHLGCRPRTADGGIDFSDVDNGLFEPSIEETHERK